MWWNALAGAIQGGIGSKAFRAATDANNRLRRLNVESREKVRQAGNLAESAKNNLSRWIQSVNNNRRLKAGGEALEANIVNARRGLDQAGRQGFANDIQNAEQAGRMAAGAAFSGIQGDVVDMVDFSVNLRNTIVDQAVADKQGMASYDVARRAASITSQMVGGLDNSVILDSLDYTKEAATQDVNFSGWQHAMFGMIKHMGGVTSDPGPKSENQQADTSLSGSYRFDDQTTESQRSSFGGQHGMSLDSNSNGARFSFEKDDDPYDLWGDKSSSGMSSSSSSGSSDSWVDRQYSF